MKYARATIQYREPGDRLEDWGEIYNHKPIKKGIKRQAARSEEECRKILISHSSEMCGYTFH